MRVSAILQAWRGRWKVPERVRCSMAGMDQFGGGGTIL